MADMKANISLTKNLLAAGARIKKYDGMANSWRSYKEDARFGLDAICNCKMSAIVHGGHQTFMFLVHLVGFSTY